MQQFTSNDRILILAPHPDDEVMATGGVIQKALKAKAKVKVLFLTNGDHNEPAFIVYEKRLTIRHGEFIYMGQVRRKESLEALNKLGLTEKDCIFLGYPDFGTMEILLKYWGDTRPFKYMLTRISKVPYSNCLSPGAPYVGESILEDMKKVIRDFKPTKVFVSSPVDVNRDHRSLYLFLQIALWDLEGEIAKPDIFPYLVHVKGWPKPRGYHPDLELAPPDMLKSGEISWLRIELTNEEIKMKHNAMKYYKSENEYNPTYLFTFARRNELVGDYPVIKLSKESVWRNAGTTLAYARKGDDLFIKLVLKNKHEKDLGISIFLLGHRKGVEFSKMPKLAINIGLNGLSVKDRKQRINGGKVQLTEEDNSLILKIPLSLLNDPVYILTCTKAGTIVLPFEDTAWRIIEFE
ncbi:MAG: PIG-L family deacetylase [Candidatus Omnitrophica bacterium]|nr:PIG-L family deacetylase [Candidatus Omnitrophota bacterium]